MERGKSYVYSERAHFMCPNMHFGMLVTIRGEYDGDKLRFCLGALSKAHPFLESVIARDESGRLYFRKTDGLTVPLIECGGEWQKDYDEISLGGWDITRECMLKAVTYPFEGEFRLLLVAHHMLCDGRGLLQLAEELAYCYVKGEQPKYVEERLISSISDLPRGSDLPFLSRAVINYANNRWRKENHRVSYDEYLKFEKKYLQENVTRRSLTTIDGSELEEIIKICREENVSVNDYLIARMMRETGSGKMIIACDIRDKISCYVPGAMGNYSTAFSVVCKTRDGDTVALAKRMSAEVAKIRKRPQREMLVLSCYMRMEPELIDSVAIATFGDFESGAGRFVGSNMFGYAERKGCCVTNLGRHESDVIKDAVFIPPSSPANRLIWGVLTMNGRDECMLG